MTSKHDSKRRPGAHSARSETNCSTAAGASLSHASSNTGAHLSRVCREARIVHQAASGSCGSASEVCTRHFRALEGLPARVTTANSLSVAGALALPVQLNAKARLGLARFDGQGTTSPHVSPVSSVSSTAGHSPSGVLFVRRFPADALMASTRGLRARTVEACMVLRVVHTRFCLVRPFRSQEKSFCASQDLACESPSALRHTALLRHATRQETQVDLAHLPPSSHPAPTPGRADQESVKCRLSILRLAMVRVTEF